MTIRTTKNFVVAALVILAVIDLAAIGVLLSPMAKSPQQKEVELRALHEQLKQKQAALGPSVGMDKKIAGATVDIAAFYRDRLPAQYSQIASALYGAAQANNVQLRSVSYKPDKHVVEDLQRVEIDLTISGPYVNNVKFINSMERDKVFFVINSVSLAGSANGVQLQVQAETYLRTGAA